MLIYSGVKTSQMMDAAVQSLKTYLIHFSGIDVTSNRSTPFMFI